MTRTFPKTSSDAAQQIRQLLDEGHPALAIQLSKDVESAGLFEAASCQELMTMTAPLAFSNMVDIWFKFQGYWDVTYLQARYGELPDPQMYLSQVLWLAEDLVLTERPGRPGAAYALLRNNLRDLHRLKPRALTDTVLRLSAVDNFVHYAARLREQRTALPG